MRKLHKELLHVNWQAIVTCTLASNSGKLTFHNFKLGKDFHHYFRDYNQLQSQLGIATCPAQWIKTTHTIPIISFITLITGYSWDSFFVKKGSWSRLSHVKGFLLLGYFLENYPTSGELFILIKFDLTKQRKIMTRGASGSGPLSTKGKT